MHIVCTVCTCLPCVWVHLSHHCIIFRYVSFDVILLDGSVSTVLFLIIAQSGRTPFMLACEAGHADTVKFLLTCDRSIVTTKDNVSVLYVCTCCLCLVCVCVRACVHACVLCLFTAKAVHRKRFSLHTG